MPTPLAALVLASALGLCSGVLARRTLRALPRTIRSAPDYESLADPAFRVGLGLATFGACFVAFTAVPWPWWLAWTSLTVVNVLAVAVDLRTTWLPLALARAGWAVAALGALVAAWATSDAGVALWAVAGALLLGGFFHLVWRFTGALGYGDVRLMATIGAVTGATEPSSIGTAAFLGTLVGAVWAIVHHLSAPRTPFPYGPALLSGPLVALLWQRLAQG